LIIIALGSIVVLLAVVAIVLRPEGTPWNWVDRVAGMVGYVATFLAILSSAYMRALYRLLGRPFLWGHHIVSISGLVLITFHPIAFAIETANAAVFVPRFDSWLVFWELAGRPALYLMAIASLGAWLRRRWRKSWRTIHMLNYVAFLLGTVHAVLIGTDFGQPFLRLVPITMALVTIAVFIRKRLGQRRAQMRKAR
jgi:DMSO/TMAO reductase YedYZ heme-binding membrane subunit